MEIIVWGEGGGVCFALSTFNASIFNIKGTFLSYYPFPSHIIVDLRSHTMHIHAINLSLTVTNGTNNIDAFVDTS